MRIVHVCTELAPIAKVGGLADVVYGLSKALIAEGHQVEVILPKYDCLDYSGLKNLRIDTRDLWSYEGYQRFNNTIWRAELEGIDVYLIEPHHPGCYFSRGTIYNCADDIDRFVYFSRAALEYLYKSNKQPDVLHLHDWPVSLAAVLYKEMYIPLGMKKCRTVLTIHNMQHQGRCSPEVLSKAGLLSESYLTPTRLLDPIFPMTINLLKGGIEYVDAVTTVSPTYEQEILTAEGSFGLLETMKRNKTKCSGILNGIDYEAWNPATDPHLPHHYQLSEAPAVRLAAKKENKTSLLKEYGLRDFSLPLVGCVTRLVPQKGPALIQEAILRTLELGGQFILLGSSPSVEIQQEFLNLQKDVREQNAVIALEYDEALAHRIYAAADMLVIPSIFEPCGLTQMIALHYGTIPIVRKTGGLADTVFDLETSDASPEMRNGFSFDAPESLEMRNALDRAFSCLRNRPKVWDKLIENGMRADFSWKNSAKEYLKIYAGASAAQPTAPSLSASRARV